MHKQTAHGGHRGNQARMPRQAFHVDALGSLQGKQAFIFHIVHGTVPYVTKSSIFRASFLLVLCIGMDPLLCGLLDRERLSYTAMLLDLSLLIR